MGLLTFSLNLTLDGCVDHREGIADDETHAFFTGLMDEGGAMLWGRLTYEMMESYWPPVARGDEEAAPTMREWAVKLEAKPKYVVSSTRKDFPWTNSHPITGGLREGVQQLKDATPAGVLLGSGKCGRTRSNIFRTVSLGGAQPVGIAAPKIEIGEQTALLDATEETVEAIEQGRVELPPERFDVVPGDVDIDGVHPQGGEEVEVSRLHGLGHAVPLHRAPPEEPRGAVDLKGAALERGRGEGAERGAFWIIGAFVGTGSVGGYRTAELGCGWPTLHDPCGSPFTRSSACTRERRPCAAVPAGPFRAATRRVWASAEP